ncbi:BlaI/MecI/CopY family transcriptional regulator [Natronospira bacteriovora]|uniref:BlaI/MecI/CopY family transcriptional regulator n=1 Tax=Natronospira bacteriovora TaxID=3069753 RepID=A0ABU0WA73_9GAMM|nr:BlaI/MecI/CopY family transcriptional regulator [Natronospira sp. AB-CW4]MDQ2070814.1 BlaI/MecI/CopY family transcriptional regulator [Natronospira sp. AB-CW4]
MKISESESRVMEVLWDAQPQHSGDIVAAVTAREDWSPKTVRTLLARLLDKGAVRREGGSRPFLYSPCLSREDWLREQTGQLVDSHCQGRLAPLVSAFARREKLSEEDRREILAILKEMEE